VVVLERPVTRFARCGDIHVAYQVVGSGPLDIVLVPEWGSHVEEAWEQPRIAAALRRMARIGRLIRFDKRGTGMSDPVTLDLLPSFDVWMDDVVSVLDAVGSDRAAVVGMLGGGSLAMLFAATYPERTRSLVLFNSFARLLRAEDYPHGMPPEIAERLLAGVETEWGTAMWLSDLAPSVAGDPSVTKWLARYERMAASPGAAMATQRMAYSTDVREALGVISAPTLVLSRASPLYRVAHAHYLAASIPNAKLVELDGSDHYWWADAAPVLAEIEEFLTGARSDPAPDRLFATVLFTDIIESTSLAASLGDSAWTEVLDAHDALVRRQLERYRGTEVNTTGDGFLASFDGPARAVQCALAIVAGVRALGIEVRAGLHSGECTIRGQDLGGLAVHIAARIGARAQAGQVLVSEAVTQLAGGAMVDFSPQERAALKGVPGSWQLYRAVQG
jgi:class 3 adenylate cyclase